MPTPDDLASDDRDTNEVHRLAALRRHDILDTPAERKFDGIVMLVQNICRVPIALVSLVHVDRQRFKAKGGVTVDQTALDQATRRVQEVEERYHAIVDSAIDNAIIAVDAGGIVTSWSAGGRADFGWSQADRPFLHAGGPRGRHSRSRVRHRACRGPRFRRTCTCARTARAFSATAR